MNIVVDSFGWIEFFTGGPRAGKYEEWVVRARPETHFTPAIILYEVYKRVSQQKGEENADSLIGQICAHTTIVDASGGIALEAAALSLRTGLAMADALIKATARQRNATVVTSDPHFKGMEGVRFID